MISMRLKAVTVVALTLGSAIAGTRSASAQKADSPRRGSFRIATLHAAGAPNAAPSDISNLTRTLRDGFHFDVVIDSKELVLTDPNLVHYPLVYLQGHAPLNFTQQDRVALRRHLDPGGGTLFVDAACGSPETDVAFRRFVAELMPDHPLVAIPRSDTLFTHKYGYNLAKAKHTAAAGGKSDFPDLEGIKIDGRWAIIYSKLDVGSAIQKQADLDCKGYTHESALRIATNIVLYATLP